MPRLPITAPTLQGAGRSPLAQGVLLALAAAALLLAPFLVDALLGRAWVRVLDLVMLYTMLALGLNIVVGFAGLLDLGYIAFFAVGAYLYALCASPHFGLYQPFWLLLPALLRLRSTERTTGSSACCWARRR